jgi:hypothetical protein
LRLRSAGRSLRTRPKGMAGKAASVGGLLSLSTASAGHELLARPC